MGVFLGHYTMCAWNRMNVPGKSVSLVASATTTSAAALPAEAIAAVDGSVATGAERNGGFVATFGANHRMHLAGTSVKTETVGGTVCAPGLAARRATLGLVRVTLFGMIRLIVGREDERLSTLHAC